MNKISVIIRTQNRLHLLERALESISQQTYTNIEAVVINDGGKNITEVVNKFKDKITNLQIIQHDKILGRSTAANTGIQAATGEWLAFLDDDDTFEINGLEILAKYISWDKEFIYGKVQLLEMHKKNDKQLKGIFGNNYDTDILLLMNSIPICAYICKREHALKINGFDKDFEYLEDWDFLYRLLNDDKLNVRVQFVDELISNYRIHGSSYINESDNKKEEHYRKLFYKKHLAKITAIDLSKSSLNFIDVMNKKTDASQDDLQKTLTSYESCATNLQSTTEHNQELNKANQELGRKIVELENNNKNIQTLNNKNIKQLEKLVKKLNQELQERSKHIQDFSTTCDEQNEIINKHLQHIHQLHLQNNELNQQISAKNKNDVNYTDGLINIFERLTLDFVFESNNEVVNLSKYGLVPPLKMFSAEISSIKEVYPPYKNLEFPVPLIKNKKFHWHMYWSEKYCGNAIMLKLGTYGRVNNCNLELILISKDNEIIKANLDGASVRNNHYAAFALDKSLKAGNYTCTLSSPNADNNNILAVWITTNFQRVGGEYVRNYHYVLEKNAEIIYKKQPLISIIMPTYNTKAHYLRECLDSVIEQIYPNWELCIADDASTQPQVREILEEYKARFPNKIKLHYSDKNQHISATSNLALDLAEGEFIALLDHDDLLTKDALFEVVKLINNSTEDIDLIYSDEDKLDDITGCYDEPFFKPDWSPEILHGQMYIGHLGIYRKSIIDEIAGFRLGVEGSQDWDLALRFTQKAKVIKHIPKILYHWRKHSDSTAANVEHKDYAVKAGLKVVQEALERENNNGNATLNSENNCIMVEYAVKDNPLVSIIIPTKDRADLLDACLSSIYNNTSYQNFEIIIVDNGSKEKATFKLFKQYKNLFGEDKFKICRRKAKFNFSYLVNQGVEYSSGELILLLNNDTEIAKPSTWLDSMIAYAQQENIACVGTKLLYGDNTIQHAGVICGLGGIANHSHLNLPTDSPGYFGRLTLIANYSAVTAACLMIKRSIWDEVNGFDEKLAVAFNDVDFCLRILNIGYRNIVLPNLTIYHHESKSRGIEDTPNKQKRFANEVKIIQKRWQYILDNDPYYNINLSKKIGDFSTNENSIYYCNDEIMQLKVIN
jgi:glycosyltransferase involved in cell wall biosynthesis